MLAPIRESWRRLHRRCHRAVLSRLRTPPPAAVASPHALLPPASASQSLLSRVYGWLLARHRTRLLARATRISPPSVPVISVGNMTFGATGKTPCVMWLAEFLLATGGGRVPLLLTRGYGDDEWRMFQARFPTCAVAVGADRRSLGAKRVAEDLAGSRRRLSCVLLDDGLQQWRIRKDLEIVMIDALTPFGNGRLLPLGSLREPPAEALARADIVLLHHANLLPATDLKALERTVRALTVDSGRRPIVATSELRVVALPTVPPSPSSSSLWPTHPDQQPPTAFIFCGVGNPESVERVVRGLRCWREVTLLEAFPDHHAFTMGDLAGLRAALEGHRRRISGPMVVLTTEKDLARAQGAIEAALVDPRGRWELRFLRCEFRIPVPQEAAVRNRIKELFAPR